MAASSGEGRDLIWADLWGPCGVARVGPIAHVGVMWADSWGPRGVARMGPIEWEPFGTHEQALVGPVWATHILPMHI